MAVVKGFLRFPESVRLDGLNRFLPSFAVILSASAPLALRCHGDGPITGRFNYVQNTIHDWASENCSMEYGTKKKSRHGGRLAAPGCPVQLDYGR